MLIVTLGKSVKSILGRSASNERIPQDLPAVTNILPQRGYILNMLNTTTRVILC